MSLRSKIVSTFKLHGLTLRSDASACMVEALEGLSTGDVKHWLEKFIEIIQKKPLKPGAISREVIEDVIEECGVGADSDDNNSFLVIDAFKVPKFVFNTDRKKFVPDHSKANIHSAAEDKAALFCERYTVLYQRTLRHELFTMPVLGSGETAPKYRLQPVEFLLSSSALLGNALVFGMVAQLKEGSYFLEDSTGSVEMDISQAEFHSGLFTENCFVLAEGVYEDRLFHVTALGFPPPEPATFSRSHLGNLNFFGGPSTTTCKASTQLAALEKENEEMSIVLLSEVWLDQSMVLDKLRVLFTGFAEAPPAAFVFCGNFCSMPCGPVYYEALKDGLKALADLICDYPSFEKTRFVFVPGPSDPGPGNILPRPALPTLFTEQICSKVPLATFTTNPCRLQYCTKEIAVFREDIMNKMCRNCIRLPSDDVDLPTHLVKTLESQAHLCPLPLHIRPVYWTQDHALHLYPLPDLVILADKYDPFTVKSQTGCTTVNPGSFARSDFQFKVYFPFKGDVQDSKIP
ncbi:DNA polymerase epsilon subunit 2-like [Sycon ciliatum]|uniref:DNA polymerase epsilon subunit 2-like n=1 Tax=Sycon ciliatum TaxID=27933 RepID=UPI0020AC0592|eukprot:scpid60322/ scgid11183/ DNA polymerase epsilon subunit 2; DNA polymerase II subunit 2; DNA polymerase epsilon subunit B